MQKRSDMNRIFILCSYCVYIEHTVANFSVILVNYCSNLFLLSYHFKKHHIETPNKMENVWKVAREKKKKKEPK